MTHHDEALEEELKAKTKGKRVTLDALNENIVSEFYFTAGEGVLGASEMGTKPAGIADSLNQLTFCVLVLKNGFTVTGQSACADPTNFDPEIGQRIAKQKAVDQIWALMGYNLKQEMFEAMEEGKSTGDFRDRVRHEEHELSAKIMRLEAFINGAVQFERLAVAEQTELQEQLVSMKEYRGHLARRIVQFG